VGLKQSGYGILRLDDVDADTDADSDDDDEDLFWQLMMTKMMKMVMLVSG
jgi:hypothetical protein